MIYNKYKKELLVGSIALLTDNIKVALLSSAYTPDVDAHEFFDDVSSYEITVVNYSPGGELLTSKTITQDNTDNEGVFDAADTVWTNATGTITAGFAVIYKDSGTPSTSPLISYIDFGADKTSENANFTITWASEGILNTN